MIQSPERHGIVHVKFGLVAGRTHRRHPERKQMSAALEQTVGRVKYGRALRRACALLRNLFHLHPNCGKPAAAFREYGHRRALAVFGRYQAVVFVRADFLRIGRRFVIKVLHARKHRLVFVSVRRPIDKQRQSRNVQRQRLFTVVFERLGFNVRVHDQCTTLFSAITHEVSKNSPSASVTICHRRLCRDSAVRIHMAAHLRL